jgi:hypothetical protein
VSDAIGDSYPGTLTRLSRLHFLEAPAFSRADPENLGGIERLRVLLSEFGAFVLRADTITLQFVQDLFIRVCEQTRACFIDTLSKRVPHST